MLKYLILIGVLLGAVSCGSSSSPQSPPDASPSKLPSNKPAKAPSNIPTYQGSDSTPPKGAQYTIFCSRVEGDLHVERANRLKSELINSTGMKDWYAVHEAGQSLLYYGYYKVINDTNDPKESARAQRDRQRIDLMSDSMGNRPFRQAMFVELTAPDPVAPPEWNLANAPGAYSLQIAAYKDSPQRKEAAVETVRAARANGVEAYYYHGPSTSLVCIGHWPENAVRISGDARSEKGEDQQQPLIVAPLNSNRDPELDAQLNQVGEQTGAKVVKPTIEIIDPSLRAAMDQYPHNNVNGMELKRTVNGKDVYDPSLLVPIPHQDAATADATRLPALSPNNPMFGAPGAVPGGTISANPLQPSANPGPQQPPASGGKLRSIGD